MTATDRLNAGPVRRYLAVVAALAMAIALLPLAGTANAQEAPQAIAVDTACEGAPQAGFEDVAEGNPHGDNVSCLFAYGITQGTADGGYAPEEGVRRWQMALFLVRLATFADEQLDTFALPQPGATDFTDIAEVTQEGQDAISILAQLGVTQGRTPTTFDPWAFVERDEMASFVNRLQGVLAAEYSTETNFFDDDNGSVHEPNINALASVGIVEGFAGGDYGPNLSVRRDQMASFVMRHVQENVNSAVLAPIDFPNFSVTMSWINELVVTGDVVEYRQGEPGATATTQLWLDAEADTVEFAVDYSNVTGPFTGFHIHTGAINENGPIALTLATAEQLNAETDQILEGTVTAPTAGDTAETEGIGALIDAILANPSGYYVNLHTETFTAGAVRGQLPTGGQDEIPAPAEAAEGAFNVTVGDVDVDANAFVGVNVAATVTDNEGLFIYEEGDTFTIGGAASDLAAFEAALSVGDEVAGDYSTTAASTFNLTDADAEPVGPQAVSASVTAAVYDNVGEELNIAYDAAGAALATPDAGDVVSVDWDGDGTEDALYTCGAAGGVSCTVLDSTLTVEVTDPTVVTPGTHVEGASQVLGTTGVTDAEGNEGLGFPVLITGPVAPAADVTVTSA